MARRATKPVRDATSDRIMYSGFGGLLKALRGKRSVAQVLNGLERQHPAIVTKQGTVSGYEQGYIKKPDAIVLWGLAQMYGASLDGLMAVLQANRENPGLSVDECQRILQRFNHGPSPTVAAATLAKAAQRLFDTAAEVEALRLEFFAPDEGETQPRR